MSKMAVDRAHSWAWAMADVKVSLPLCPARMLNACGICAKLELICVRLVLRMCVRVSGRSDCMMSAGLRGFGYGFIYRAIASAVHVEQSNLFLYITYCRGRGCCLVRFHYEPIRDGRLSARAGCGDPACTVPLRTWHWPPHTSVGPFAVPEQPHSTRSVYFIGSRLHRYTVQPWWVV